MVDEVAEYLAIELGGEKSERISNSRVHFIVGTQVVAMLNVFHIAEQERGVSLAGRMETGSETL